MVLSLLAALPILGADPGRVTVPFRLFVSFERQAPEDVREAIRNELDTIYAPMGWNLTWSSPSTDAAKVAIRLVVARFDGTCDPTTPTQFPAPVGPLGASDVSQGEVRPFVNVYCDAIRAVVASTLALEEPRDRRVAYGRAVGRVLAHELYHVLANTTGHAWSGLGESSLSPSELLARRFLFRRSEVQQLRGALVPLLLGTNRSLRFSVSDKGSSVFITSGCSGCHGTDGQGTRWGPALRTTRKACTPEELAAQLHNRRSEMYRLAKQLGVLWPELGADDIEALAAFLRNLSN